MRLSDFILSNLEPILAEWETFARTHVPAGEAMDVAALRDHAADILKTVALDLQCRQSERARAEKSKGDAEAPAGAADTAAQTHGALRAEAGFTLGQMVSEFRALRASVIRLWRGGGGGAGGGAGAGGGRGVEGGGPGPPAQRARGARRGGGPAGRG